MHLGGRSSSVTPGRPRPDEPMTRSTLRRHRDVHGRGVSSDAPERPRRMNQWELDRPAGQRFLFAIDHARVARDDLLQAVYDALGALDAVCPARSRRSPRATSSASCAPVSARSRRGTRGPKKRSTCASRDARLRVVLGGSYSARPCAAGRRPASPGTAGRTRPSRSPRPCPRSRRPVRADEDLRHGVRLLVHQERHRGVVLVGADLAPRVAVLVELLLDGAAPAAGHARVHEDLWHLTFP